MKNLFLRRWFKFISCILICIALVVVLVVGVNVSVDASYAISSNSYDEAAKLQLEGNTIAFPTSYKQRVFQSAVVSQMETMPENIVIGSSRGMYLGKKITGYEDIYNNCVFGNGMEDYYALLGLYYREFGALPKHIIIEISPWVFYEDSEEFRWTENYEYRTAAENFYKVVTGEELKIPDQAENENMFVSLDYFKYNVDMIGVEGVSAFAHEEGHVSTDSTEFADLPDGTIRYKSTREEPSEKRYMKVLDGVGAVTYCDVDKMTEIGETKQGYFEAMIQYLLDNDIEVEFFLAPFSPTACTYIYDQNTNPVFDVVEDYLYEYAQEYDIQITGHYDAREVGARNWYFMDFMHPDKTTIKRVWQSNH